MRPEDAEVFEIAASLVAVMASTRALFAWDERRMTEEQKERAWPASTRGMIEASPLFFPLWLVGVPLHFVRTRQSARGVVEGVLALVAIYGASIVAVVVVGLLTDT